MKKVTNKFVLTNPMGLEQEIFSASAEEQGSSGECLWHSGGIRR